MTGSLRAIDPLLTYGLFGLAPSWHCDAFCRHCFIPACKRARDQYSPGIIEYVYRELPKGPVLVAITGGEPFLHPRRLHKLIRLNSDSGLATSLVTNGLWAQDDKKRNRLLRKAHELGLSAICISVDDYHRPAVPIATVIELAQLARELGMCVEIQGVGRAAVRKLASVTKSGVLSGPRDGVSKINLETTGTASGLPVDILSRKKANCCLIALKPIVLPDGRVLACCSPKMFDIKNSVLQLGRVQDDSLAEILHRASRSYLLAAVIALGPVGLAKLLGKSGQLRGGTQCALCIHLLNNEKNVEALRKRLESDKELLKEIAGRLMLIESR